MRVHAYAKINLALQVLGIRADGMHNLRMIMQEIDLHDVLDIEHAPELTVDISGVHSVNNTVYAAANAFFLRTGIKTRAHIVVKKNIPMQSGLGGGSADAAATLRALNEMYGFPLTEMQLTEMGNLVGADVPFCLMGGCRVATGTGDKLRKIQNNLDVYYVVAKPNTGVSTGRAFTLYDEMNLQSEGDFQGCEAAVILGDLRAFSPINDLERAAIALCPDIQKLLYELKRHTNIAFMTGSGSACVGVFEEGGRAEKCVDSLDCFARVVRGRCYERD